MMSELTADDLTKMLIEIMTHQVPTLRGPEADAARARLKKQVEEIKARGWSVDIPPEIGL